MKKNIQQNIELGLELYKKMYLIRLAEEKIREYYPKDEIKMPVHLAIGEEAIAAGVCQALRTQDQIFGTYRNHGIYLAKTNDTYYFFAELFGKKTGLSQGKAGSMHIMAPEKGFMVTSAIVASTIPIAVGAAFANQYKKNNKITAVFFGDGAVDEGVFWESLNFACLKQLPILFICEDNSYAIHSHIKERHGYKSITEITKKFDCLNYQTETTDVEKIFNLTKTAIKECLKFHKPVFMHLKYYRYLQHVGINKDFHFGYRSENEFVQWFKKDPITLQRNRLLNTLKDEAFLLKIESEINNKIVKSINLARQDKFPTKDELYQDVYYE